MGLLLQKGKATAEERGDLGKRGNRHLRIQGSSVQRACGVAWQSTGYLVTFEIQISKSCTGILIQKCIHRLPKIKCNWAPSTFIC